jgi:hypothetical protein
MDEIAERVARESRIAERVAAMPVKVVGITAVGSAFSSRHGMTMPGWHTVKFSNGMKEWAPGNLSFDDAIDHAIAHLERIHHIKADGSEYKRKLDAWVKTGDGLTFGTKETDRR